MASVVSPPEFDAVEKLVMLTDLLTAELDDLNTSLSEAQRQMLQSLLERANGIIAGSIPASGNDIAALAAEIERVATTLGLLF